MQAKTHDLGNLFVQRLTLKRGTSLFHRASTNETEFPYRTAISYILRVPGTKFGIAFGRWKHTGRDEEEALLNAIAGSWFEAQWSEPSNKEKIEAFIAKYATDEDEEEIFKDMLGLNDNDSATLPANPSNRIWRPQGSEAVRETLHQ